MKVLITGSREWENIELIKKQLENLPPNSLIIHGACRGADFIAGSVAKELGLKIKAYPAHWDLYGLAAGPKRNQQMLDENQIDLCLVFHFDLENSKGTKDMVARCKAKGIEVRIFTGRGKND